MVSESAQKLISAVQEIDGVRDIIYDCLDESGLVMPHILLGRVAELFCEAVSTGNEWRAELILTSIESAMDKYDDEIYELVQVGFLEMIRNICGLDAIKSGTKRKISVVASSM
jgi:hypothetical protein